MASELERQYSKERQRIQRFIRSAERRNYIFPKNSLPPKPKKITPASVERLKKITPAKLYEKAEYIVPETGEVVSGRKGRILERKKATEKAKKTRHDKRIRNLYENNEYEPSNEPDFEQRRRRQDKKDRGKFDDDDYADTVSQGEATYQWILRQIEEKGDKVKKAADKLRKLLDDEISKYGRDKVMRQIAQYDDEIRQEVESELYYRNTVSDTEVALFNIKQLITGEAPTMEDAKDANDFADVSEEMDDFIDELFD